MAHLHFLWYLHNNNTYMTEVSETTTIDSPTVFENEKQNKSQKKYFYDEDIFEQTFWSQLILLELRKQLK